MSKRLKSRNWIERGVDHISRHVEKSAKAPRHDKNTRELHDRAVRKLRNSIKRRVDREIKESYRRGRIDNDREQYDWMLEEYYTWD